MRFDLSNWLRSTKIVSKHDAVSLFFISVFAEGEDTDFCVNLTAIACNVATSKDPLKTAFHLVMIIDESAQR